MSTKVILKCGYSPGDVVLLSAAVRDLHLHYPGKFVTDVRTRCPQIWEHNPYLSAIQDDDREAVVIDCWIPLINRSNEAPYHALHGFIEFLNEKLGVSAKPTVFKGDIHLSEQEKAWFSQVHEVTGRDIPFWIVAAGGKYDVTIKWWHTSRYQEVVDRLRGRIQFVQVGEYGHHHPRLNGVIDFRGKTSLRELIRLVYHSQGVLCSVTALMHLAAAVEPKRGNAMVRPAVVIAGGREPAHWEAYPGHQFIHTVGTLPCCNEGGCWRDRVVPLRDGDRRDKPENLCVNLVKHLPRCLDMITAADVSRHIEMYAEGGVIGYLSAQDSRSAEKGILITEENDFDNQPLSLASAGMACDEVLGKLSTALPAWEGRGIVICGGGVRYFTNTWVCINMLRHVGCPLPIEVWHLGKKEMTPRMSKLLASVGAKTVDALEVRKAYPMRELNGWELKPYSIFYSAFNEVLFLDADNVPIVNPEFLFSSQQFRATGAVFWPDFNHVTGKNPAAVWKSFGVRRPSEREFETGQILIDKARCVVPLRLCLWINENSDFYYQYLHGDKETFHLAFRKCKKSYYLIRTPVYPLEATMCQHDFDGKRIFQHRNMDKWDLVWNRRIRGFRFEETCRGYIAKLRTLWGGSLRPGSSRARITRAARSAPKIAVIVANSDRRGVLTTVEHLKNMNWDGRISSILIESNSGKPPNFRAEISKCLENSTEYILFLNGDVILNEHLYHNLLQWKPLQARYIATASLYNPQVREFACDFENNARMVDPQHLLDGPALMLNREAAGIFLSSRNRFGELNSRFIQTARKLKRPVYIHAPSLIQRAPQKKGNALISQAPDFDPRWRA